MLIWLNHLKLENLGQVNHHWQDRWFITTRGKCLILPETHPQLMALDIGLCQGCTHLFVSLHNLPSCLFGEHLQFTHFSGIYKTVSDGAGGTRIAMISLFFSLLINGFSHFSSKNQTLSGSRILNVRASCFSSSSVIVNEESLGVFLCYLDKRHFSVLMLCIMKTVGWSVEL